MEASLGRVVDELVSVALGVHSCIPDDLYDSIFQQLDLASEDIQLRVMQKLNQATQRYTRVKLFCTRAGWTPRLLQRFVQSVDNRVMAAELVTLCSTLCAFSVTVKEMRLLLRLMRGSTAKQRCVMWCVCVCVCLCVSVCTYVCMHVCLWVGLRFHTF